MTEQMMNQLERYHGLRNVHVLSTFNMGDELVLRIRDSILLETYTAYFDGREYLVKLERG